MKQESSVIAIYLFEIKKGETHTVLNHSDRKAELQARPLTGRKISIKNQFHIRRWETCRKSNGRKTCSTKRM